MVFLKHIHKIACFYEFHLRFVWNIAWFQYYVLAMNQRGLIFIYFDELSMMAKNKANKVQSRWKLDNDNNEELLDKNLKFLQNIAEFEFLWLSEIMPSFFILLQPWFKIWLKFWPNMCSWYYQVKTFFINTEGSRVMLLLGPGKKSH